MSCGSPSSWQNEAWPNPSKLPSTFFPKNKLHTLIENLLHSVMYCTSMIRIQYDFHTPYSNVILMLFSVSSVSKRYQIWVLLSIDREFRRQEVDGNFTINGALYLHFWGHFTSWRQRRQRKWWFTPHKAFSSLLSSCYTCGYSGLWVSALLENLLNWLI